MEYFRQAVPDPTYTVEDQVAEGDKVVSRYTVSGTHRDEFRGIASTGKEMEITGTSIFRFSEEGKVVESWDNLDQLGAIPEPG